LLLLLLFLLLLCWLATLVVAKLVCFIDTQKHPLSHTHKHTHTLVTPTHAYTRVCLCIYMYMYMCTHLFIWTLFPLWTRLTWRMSRMALSASSRIKRICRVKMSETVWESLAFSECFSWVTSWRHSQSFLPAAECNTRVREPATIMRVRQDTKAFTNQLLGFCYPCTLTPSLSYRLDKCLFTFSQILLARPTDPSVLCLCFGFLIKRRSHSEAHRQRANFKWQAKMN